MEIYTKTGDNGTTGVIGGRLEKDHPRVEAYGTVDELNSLVGMAIVSLEEERDADIQTELANIQQALFDCGADLATLPSAHREFRIGKRHVEAIESLIDHYAEQTEKLQDFIIPGGTHCSALLHLCRTAARKAERRVITLERGVESSNPSVKTYLNRLSDLFFVLARIVNARAGVPDVFYK